MCDYRSETTNFTWDRALVLGQGTVGSVFYGIRKGTSERVAVKCFTGAGHDRSIHMKLREIDVLRKLSHSHENIVQILGVEDELFPTTGRPNGKKALILELCTGGSLATVLRKPENHYGLPESDFLCFWEHITNAMKHLRDLNICHRDIKPANILIHVKDNGSKVYKLADFDTARELDEGECFPSLVGTVPYLNPQMYEKAVVQIPGKNCSTSVDLWSIGVTLYETATGRLPFRPHNWNTRSGLNEVLSGKPSGAISGVQSEPNGPILYATKFPTTCLLSLGLQTLLAPIIAFLCEANEEAQWTYQKYFTQSNDVLSRKRVHIFYLNRVHSLCIYLEKKPSSGKITETTEPKTNRAPGKSTERMEPNRKRSSGPRTETTEVTERSYDDLVAAIHVQTSVPVESQVLFYKNSQLKSFLGSDGSLRPIQTTEDTPLILWNCKSEAITPDLLVASKKFKQFGNIPDIYNDAKTVTLNMRNAYVLQRKLEGMNQKIHFIQTAVSTLNQYIIELVMQVSKDSNTADSLRMSLENHFEMTKVFIGLCRSLLASVQTIQTQKDQKKPEKIINTFKVVVDEMEDDHRRVYWEFRSLSNELFCITPSVTQLNETRIQARSLVLLWDELIQSVKDINNVNEFLKTGSKLMSEMELSFNILQLETKANNGPFEPESISHAREYYRYVERLKMPATYQSYLNLVAPFQTLFESVTRKFGEWYDTVYFMAMQPEILKGHLAKYLKSFESTELKMTRTSLPGFRKDLFAFERKLKHHVAAAELKAAAKEYASKETQTPAVQATMTRHKFMDHFHNLAATPTDLQLELEKNGAMLDESMLLLSSLVSKLTTNEDS